MEINFKQKVKHGSRYGKTYEQIFLSGFSMETEHRLGCWLWNHLAIGMRIESNFVHISHVAYQYFIGQVPDGMSVLHTCENRRCVNPDHLYLAQYFQNLKDRFLKKIEKTDNCWNWIGSLRKDGYGRIIDNKKVYLAHRVAYMLLVGDIPDGMFVCHHCDNPKCVNPEHLFLGNNSDNMRDMVNKHRNWHPVYNSEYPLPRLTDEEVRKIKSMLETMPAKRISEELGISETRISRIKRGIIYKDIP